jgi:predicted transposase/invertase (TIGR01784 family)
MEKIESGELVCKPSLDVVFKKLFTENTELLKDFLSLALETEIQDLDIVNTELLPEQFDEKFSRLDISLTAKDGEKINVELQNEDKGNFKERSLFYCSKLFAKDFYVGKDYRAIPRTVCINILQFPLFKGDNYRSTVFPIIKETGETISEKWEIIYFETPKLPAEITNRMELWLKFFTVDTEEELEEMENTGDSMIRTATIRVRHMDADEQMREKARARFESQMTAQFIRNEALLEGYEKGKLDMVHALRGMGMSAEQIARAADLPLSAIEEL